MVVSAGLNRFAGGWCRSWGNAEASQAVLLVFCASLSVDKHLKAQF